MTGDSPARLIIEALRLDREPPSAIRRRALAALEVGIGGFILFGGRVDEVARLLEEVTASAGRPLWLAADLERGAGQQFAGATSLPPPAALARAPDPVESVRLAGRITGKEARELGLNWVLAPVLDLDLTGENPIVDTRAFGSDPQIVAGLGRTWIEACQTEGPAACAKHFPGHGRTRADSHLELPLVDASAAELEADLTPFGETADVVATMMVAHVAYPELSAPGSGAGRPPPIPASRDPSLLRRLLRDEIGYRGLVASDALVMRGFADPKMEQASAVDAVRAGCDLLVYPSDAAATAAALARAADDDPEFSARVSKAAARSREGLGARTAAAAGASRRQSATAEPPDLGRLVSDLAEHTLVTVAPAGAGNRRPTPVEKLRPSRPVRVRVLSDDLEVGPAGSVGRTFAQTLLSLGWDVVLERGPEVPAEGSPRQLALLLVSSPQAYKGRMHLRPETERALRGMLEAQRSEPACLVALAHRRLLERLGLPGLCAWSPEPVMEQAAARWIDRAARAPSRSSED